jgi:hypothetical protein
VEVKEEIKIAMEYQTFALLKNGNVTQIFYNFEFDPETRYITLPGGESTPIEDFGDYILSPRFLTKIQAYNAWIKNALV